MVPGRSSTPRAATTPTGSPHVPDPVPEQAAPGAARHATDRRLRPKFGSHVGCWRRGYGTTAQGGGCLTPVITSMTTEWHTTATTPRPSYRCNTLLTRRRTAEWGSQSRCSPGGHSPLRRAASSAALRGTSPPDHRWLRSGTHSWRSNSTSTWQWRRHDRIIAVCNARAIDDATMRSIPAAARIGTAVSTSRTPCSLNGSRSIPWPRNRPG
jgi:hypothetical protein